MMRGNVKLSLDRVSFAYDTRPVLTDLSFHVHEKEVVTIVGPNGGGKTTLLRLILGLLKPTSGSIRIDGENPTAAKKQMGYVPQYTAFDERFPITVFEIVLLGRVRAFGFYSKHDKERARAALETVGLLAKKDDTFHALSGGQQQRVLIARALATDTDILMLDEPTSNIDSATGEQLYTLLERLAKDHTILLVTHDTGFVSGITDRVLCVNRTLVEHPLDSAFSDLVQSSYSAQSRIVRHDKTIARTCCADCDE